MGRAAFLEEQIKLQKIQFDIGNLALRNLDEDRIVLII